jgi:hypothetical protein
VKLPPFGGNRCGFRRDFARDLVDDAREISRVAHGQALPPNNDRGKSNVLRSLRSGGNGEDRKVFFLEERRSSLLGIRCL